MRINSIKQLLRGRRKAQNSLGSLLILALIILALGVMLVATAPMALALGHPSDYDDGVVTSGVLDSRHNLGAYGVHYRADNSDSNGGTTEICIFCHTAHHANTIAPIWNRLTDADLYIPYGTTVAGTNITMEPCGISLACLSCHDGVTSFDTLINAPGKGNDGFNNVTATDFNWTFTEDGNTVSDVMTSLRLTLGTDLRDDHPVCEIYDETVGGLRPLNTVIASISMTMRELTINVEDDSRTTTSNRWTIKGFVDTDATIGDLLRGDNRNVVECTSCHDPHFYNKSWTEVASTWGPDGSDDSDGLFLRRIGGNSLSGVCRTCHDK